MESHSILSLFILFMVTNTLMNMDHGSIPAATTPITEEFDLTSSQLGTLGSMVYIGITVGSLTASYIFHKFGAKSILTLMLTLTSLGEILFPFSLYSQCMMFVCRFFTGFFQVFISIYIPVWIDIYAP